ncbi:MAG: IS1595 family transposase [Acidobacteria bacterium]|nr:MAG: IS1595 family transposase [Acidobacteriota bacterium]HEU0047886.1 IS1595 family transposase [Nitrososphaera sp.]
MNLVELNGHYSTEDKCREQLKRLRWPEGVICPRCKSKTISRLFTQGKFECSDCQYQFSVTVGTVFHDSHLPLTKWFMATLLLCESKKGMSACQIQRILGIGGYKTAWYLCHRIRSAMKEAGTMLDGTVEVDETYVGGKFRKGMPRTEKQVVIGIRQRGGQLRLIHAADVKAKTVREILGNNLSEDVEVIVTDESAVYPFALNKKQRAKHKTIQHKREYVNGLVHTNTAESAFSLLKRGIMGTWHNVSAKHLQAYLDEMVFRFDRRKSSDLFLDTLRHMVTAPVLTFERLTA